MLTIKTCPTSDLEQLCRQYGTPTTLEESAILAGAKHELANRNDEILNIRDTTDESEPPVWHAAYQDSCKALDRESAQLRA